MPSIIDLAGTLRRLVTAIGSIPTTVMRGTDNALLAADYVAERGTDDATLQATWTDAMATALANYTAARAAYLDELDFDLQAALVAIDDYVDELETRLTAARAGYLDELAAANIPSDVDDILANVAVVDHHKHSRCRVYPQSIKNTITLVADAAVDTFGNWTEIIPIDTVDFDYEIVGIVVEAVDAATGYFFQLGFSTVDGSDPTTAQILGERRLRIVTVPIAKANEMVEFYSQDCPSNAKLWGRLKTASLAADEADISVVVLRHQEVTNPIAPLATWPWAS